MDSSPVAARNETCRESGKMFLEFFLRFSRRIPETATAFSSFLISVIRKVFSYTRLENHMGHQELHAQIKKKTPFTSCSACRRRRMSHKRRKRRWKNQLLLVLRRRRLSQGGDFDRGLANGGLAPKCANRAKNARSCEARRSWS